MSAPDLPRFKLSSVTGYPLKAGGKRAATAWYVLDTWDVHRVVSAWLPFTGGTESTPNMISSPARRRERAAARCAELEAWHAEAMANDAA